MPSIRSKNIPAKSTTEKKEEINSSKLNVYVEKSCTKNMGEYNSAKVTIGVTLPYNPTKEDIEAATSSVKVGIEIVDEALEREVLQLLEEGVEDATTHPLSSIMRNKVGKNKRRVK